MGWGGVKLWVLRVVAVCLSVSHAMCGVCALLSPSGSLLAVLGHFGSLWGGSSPWFSPPFTFLGSIPGDF